MLVFIIFTPNKEYDRKNILLYFKSEEIGRVNVMYHLKKNQIILFTLFITILSYFLYHSLRPLVQETNTTSTAIHPLITCRKVGEGFQAVEPTAIFYIDSPAIHSLLQFENLPKASNLTTKWFYGSQDQEPLHVTSIDVSGSDTAHFWIQAPAQGWYIGNYLIEIYLNEELLETREIIVTYK